MLRSSTYKKCRTLASGVFNTYSIAPITLLRMALQNTAHTSTPDNENLTKQPIILEESTSTEVPWFRPEIGDQLKPPVRKLFEEYSNIPSKEVVSHISKIVSNSQLCLTTAFALSCDGLDHGSLFRSLFAQLLLLPAPLTNSLSFPSLITEESGMGN